MIIRASNDADAAAEVEIHLNGVNVLMPTDFRFLRAVRSTDAA